MPGPTPTWTDWDTDVTYISRLNVDGNDYTIKDSQARANIDANKYDIELLKQTVAGGVHFRGITDTAIADGDGAKVLHKKGGTETDNWAVADQNEGDIFIYQGNDGVPREFIVYEKTSSKYYSEFGSTGALRSMAFCDTASGSTTVPLSSNITFNTFTPNVTKGTLSVSTSVTSISVQTTDTRASVQVGDIGLRVPSSTVQITPSTSSFTALSDVTYDGSTEALTLTSATSASYWTGASASTSEVTVSAPGPTVTVTYARASMPTVSALTGATLTGEVSVTGAKPTATITNPTITVTVSPNAAS